MQIVKLNQPATMTSREITAICGVMWSHDHVKASMERLAEDEVIGEFGQLSGQAFTDGKTVDTEYLLSKRDSLIFISHYKPGITHRIVDYWQKIEDKKSSQADKTSQPATGTEDRVCDLIAARQRLGVAKYGTTVSANPLTHREWLQHALEEALDLSIYLQRSLEELDAMRDDLK